MNDIIENNEVLRELLGIPETYILPAQPGDLILVHVDPENTEEQMVEYGKKIKEFLPDNNVVVLPKNVLIRSMPVYYAKNSVIVATIEE